MYPYLFTLEIPYLNFTLEPRFYGLFYVISLLIGYRIFLSEVKRRYIPLNADQAMDATFFFFFGGLIGARMYEVIMEWPNLYAHRDFWEVFAIWKGGLAIHGGILGGMLALLIYCRRHQLRILEIMDIGALCLILAQAIGRWGNFTNGEAGGPVTDYWTGLVFPLDTHIGSYAQGQAAHPTMIYESLANFLLFLILWNLRKKNFRPGMLASLYLIGYSLIRSLLTPLRMDNQFIVLFGEKILSAYAISVVLTSVAIYWIYTNRAWEIEPPQPPQPIDNRPLSSDSPTKKKKKQRKRR